MRTRIDRLGAAGLNTDVQPYLLDSKVVTDMRNVITSDGELRSASGETKLFDLDIAPTYRFSFLGYDSTTPVQYFVVSDGVDVWIYTWDGTGEDITPTSAFTGGPVTFTTLNGILVVNSATDGAFYWPGTGDPLEALPGWDADWLCRDMKAYGYQLVALGMLDDDDGPARSKLRWSSSAAAGELPAEWVPAAENDAGDAILGETSGDIVGGCLMRDRLAVVKEDSVWWLQYVGGDFVMQLTRAHGEHLGTRLQEGFAEMAGGLVLFTIGDVLLFDGNTAKSLAEGRVRKRIKDSVSMYQWRKAQVSVNHAASTLTVCIPETGYDRLTAAYIYNWEEDTWSVRGIGHAYGLGSGNPDDADDSEDWDTWGATIPWDDRIDRPWDAPAKNHATNETVLFQSNEDNDAWWVSVLDRSTVDVDGGAVICSVERVALPIEGADGLAMIREVWPEVRGSIPSVQMSIGSQMAANGDITWEGPFTVVPNQQICITPRITGRFIAWRIHSEDVGDWAVSSLTLDWVRAGER